MKKFVYKNAGKPEKSTGKTLSGFSLLFFTLALFTLLPYFAVEAEAARAGNMENEVLSRKAPADCAVPPHKIHHAGPVLLFSDSPETVDRGGILFQDTVKGKLRVFYHHVNATGEKMKLAVLLRPAENRPVVLTLGTRGVSLPSSNYLKAAKESQKNYFTDYAVRRAQWLETADDAAVGRAASELDFSFYRDNKFLKNISLLPGESYELLASVGAGEEGEVLTREDKIRRRWQRTGRANKAYGGSSLFAGGAGFGKTPGENAGMEVLPGALASGMLDFRVNRLTEVTVLMYPEKENPWHYLKTAEKLPFDAHPLRGTFQAADIVYDFGEMDLAPAAASDRAVSEAAASERGALNADRRTINDEAADFGVIDDEVADFGVIDVEAADDDEVADRRTTGIALCVQNDAQFLKGKEALTGENTEDYGNYGVVYHMRCSFTKEVPGVSLWVNPQGGVFAGCGLIVMDRAQDADGRGEGVNQAQDADRREEHERLQKRSNGRSEGVKSARYIDNKQGLLQSRYSVVPIPSGRLCFDEADRMECIYGDTKERTEYFYDFLWSPAGASNLPLRFFLLSNAI